MEKPLNQPEKEALIFKLSAFVLLGLLVIVFVFIWHIKSRQEADKPPRIEKPHEPGTSPAELYAKAKEDGREKLRTLIKFYEGDKEFLSSTKSDEHKTRTDLIDTFFEALGWDISNRKDVHYHLRDTVEEDRLYFLGGNKRVDYSLRISGRNKIALEAKGAFTSLTSDPKQKPGQKWKSKGWKDFYYQTKRYGWSSSSIDIAILTNFKEFRVFDCRIKPNIKKPNEGLIEKFSLDYTQYLDNFDLLYDTFSKDAVRQGSLEKLLDENKKLQRRKPMHKKFLKDLDDLRLKIAQNLWDNNKLSAAELNEASQRNSPVRGCRVVQQSESSSLHPFSL